MRWKTPEHFPWCSRLSLADVAKQITDAIGIPTIGIGSGEHCDGQILVTHDLIGLFPWFTPKFVSPEARVAEEIRRAARAFIERTRGAADEIRDVIGVARHDKRISDWRMPSVR